MDGKQLIKQMEETQVIHIGLVELFMVQAVVQNQQVMLGILMVVH